MLTLSVSFSECKQLSDGTKDQTKMDFEIKVHERFKIKLESNPTTGYQWKWSNKQDISIVDSTNWRYVADFPVRTGSGGKEIWTFEGIKTGIDTIKMEYYRSWEKNVPSAESKTFIVQVR